MIIKFSCNLKCHGPLTRYAKLRVAYAQGMPGTFPPPLRVSDPDIHHGTCVTHVPWCMPGSLTSRGGFPGIPEACATRNFAYLVRGPCLVHKRWASYQISNFIPHFIMDIITYSKRAPWLLSGGSHLGLVKVGDFRYIPIWFSSFNDCIWLNTQPCQMRPFYPNLQQ